MPQDFVKSRYCKGFTFDIKGTAFAEKCGARGIDLRLFLPNHWVVSAKGITHGICWVT